MVLVDSMALMDLKAFVDRIIALYGGRQPLLDSIEKRVAEFNHIWNQDTDHIGRVLRTHLVVEHFLTEYIEAENPNLGPMDRARLSYAQKIELLNPANRIVAALIPGLRVLGQIRNRLAHRLRFELNDDDREAFLSVDLFRAMREASAERGTMPSLAPTDENPLTILEDFARFAAGLFHAGSAPDAKFWKEALEMNQSVAKNDFGEKSDKSN